jgi:hypothetical protein
LRQHDRTPDKGERLVFAIPGEVYVHLNIEDIYGANAVPISTAHQDLTLPQADQPQEVEQSELHQGMARIPDNR